MNKHRVLVVEQLMVIRKGLVSVLERVPNIEITAVCEEANRASIDAKGREYDLALVNLELGVKNGIALGQELIKLQPELKVIIYTKAASTVLAAEVYRHEFNSPRRRRLTYNLINNETLPNSNQDSIHNSSASGSAAWSVFPPFVSGLHGYLLLKNITDFNIERYLEILLRQGNVIDPEIVDLLLDRLKRPNLTPRETECSELISRGLSNREISRELGITQQAVENLINNLYNKLSITGEPKDPGRRVLLALMVKSWRGLRD